MKAKYLFAFILLTAVIIGCSSSFVERNRPGKILQEGDWIPYHTKHFDFFYRPASRSSERIQIIASRQENNYLEILNRLHLLDHNFRAIFFIFSSFEEYDRITDAGQYGNGHEIGIYDAIYGVDDYSLSNVMGKHELTHFIVDKYFGLGIRGPFKWITSEGIAVWIEDHWDGMDLYDFARQRLSEGSISTPYSIITNDEPEKILKNSYPMAGAFAKYMIETYGVAKFVKLYQQAAVLESFEQIYGTSLIAVNNKFLEFLLDKSADIRKDGNNFSRGAGKLLLFQHP
ncbi:MAG: hypothetical protein ACM3S2_03035 [Ignavibacteriales bacterium]